MMWDILSLLKDHWYSSDTKFNIEGFNFYTETENMQDG